MVRTRQISILEVAPRDGLQNESARLSTTDKIALIAHVIAYGARRIEVASFVRPDRVPQMADAEAVVAGLPDRTDVSYIALVLNRRGAERALMTRIDELGAVAVASNTFAQRNQGQTSAESLATAVEIVGLARAAGRIGQITIGAAFGCPFEGEIDPAHVVDMARRAADSGAIEVAIADTIGVAVPAHVAELVERVHVAIHPLPVRVHFHNTRNTGLANVWAAVEAGASVVDASLGGIGGCPFAPAATGNVPTEDVLYLLDRSGIDTGLSLEPTLTAARWLTDIIGRPLPGMTSRAGGFPPPNAS